MRDNMKDLKHFNPFALREKYSAKSLNKTNNYSSFWMGDSMDSHYSIFDVEDVKPKVDLIALSSYRRAIANFVSILTGDPDIKVTYTTSGDSYTDGKSVTISSKMDDKLYDSTVGLALHEGSHIKLSDFDFLRNLEANIPAEYFVRGEMKGFPKMEILSHIKNLLNYVEDRRIDNYVFSTSPGYKGYYHSMYDKYFHAKVIDKALGTDEYTDENWDSYIFRVLNLTNKNTNLNSVKGLRDIWKVLDLKNINRLKSSEEAFQVALEVYNIILNNVPDGVEKTDEEGNTTYEKADGSGSSEEGGESSGSNNSGGNDDSETLSDDEFDSLIDSIENPEKGSGESGGKSINVDLPMSGESSGGGMDVGKETKKVELSDRQKKMLEKAIEKQKKFMDGDIAKKKITKKVMDDLKTVEESGMGYHDVGKDLKDKYLGKATPTKCIVVRNLTKSLIDSNTVNMLSTYKYARWGYSDTDGEGFVEKGIRIGTILGKKLQIRGESRDTKWTRKDSGKIDKRLIAELGFGNDRVFHTTFVESYADAFLHISVDASGSMSGDKWNNTMTSVVAICKAVSMIQNVDVVVSVRSTQSGSGSYRSRRDREYPIILLAYDSRVDKFSKVKNLFPYIRCSGTTPEGLCYEAVMNEIVPSSNNRESYFLNFSDGMPMFSNSDVEYYHDTALNHTKKMVEEIKNRGIKMLSYYIGDSYDSNRYMKDFKTMYGKDSQFIDVTSVMSISKTMNKKFLEKN
tara:strand:- start:2775 stop:4994 length:2220 start_codon:yes stop_codon:yes gene_type:complete